MSLKEHLVQLLRDCHEELDQEIDLFARSQGVDSRLSALDVDFLNIPKEQLFARVGYRMKMVAALQRLLQVLRSADIRVLCFKGPALSQLLFDDPFRRDYGDLDIIIPPDQVHLACEALKEEGYESRRPYFETDAQREAHRIYGKAQNFSLPRPACKVDLHWKLLSQWAAFEIPFETLWTQRQTLSLANRWRCDTFSPVHTILFLAFHGSQDGWAKLKQLVDLTDALNTLQFDPVELRVAAGSRRPLLDQALSLAVELLNATPPTGFQSTFENRDTALEFLVTSMRRAEPPHAALLKPSLWSEWSVATVGTVLSATLTPSIEDIASVKLPLWTIPFYRIVRLGRLLKKAVQRQCPVISAST